MATGPFSLGSWMPAQRVLARDGALRAIGSLAGPFVFRRHRSRVHPPVPLVPDPSRRAGSPEPARLLPVAPPRSADV